MILVMGNGHLAGEDLHLKSMHHRIIRLLILAVCTIAGGRAMAQLVVSTATTPAQIVQNVLLGPGVTAMNIQFFGDPDQIGTFNGQNCNVGLDSGMVMCTGNIAVALGPNNTGSASNGGGNFGVGDPDLDAIIAPQTTNDRAALEFDFVPTGDSVKFRFVFGSEEYLEFVNSINDAFGFFLSGPGINGPYQNNAENIALIPGTNQPVTINSLNNMQYPQYYVNNGNGTQAPQNGSPFYIQFDGFTTVLTAKAQVICGQTYHIKIVIADASDTVWDSGVFIEAGSFQSNAITLDTEITAGGNDSILYEGCGEALLTLVRAGLGLNADTVFLSTSGVALGGVDYTGLPNQVVFQPGQDSIQILIQAFQDNLVEPLEQAVLTAITNGDCGVDTATIVFYIQDAPDIDVVLSNDTTVQCQGDSAFLSAIVSGGYGDLHWTWSAGLPADTASGWVQPTATTTYVLTATDACGQVTTVDDVTVTVPVPAPLVVQALPDTTVFCPESPVQLTLVEQGGSGGNQYLWSTGSNAATINVAPPVTATYSLTVTDECGAVATDDVTITVQYDTVRVTILSDTTICKGDTAWMLADASLGYNGYSYVWNTGPVVPAVGFSPNSNSTYSVVVTDGCGISATDDVDVGVNAPVAAFSYTGSVYVTNFPIQFLDQSVGGTAWSWDFGYPGLVSNAPFPVISYPADGLFNVMLAIEDALGCVDTTYRTVFINPEFQFYAPSAFTPDGDAVNDVFHGSGVGIDTYEVMIFDRWGELIFTSTDPTEAWDGTSNGVECPNGVYVYMFRLRAIAGEVKQFTGHVTLIR